MVFIGVGLILFYADFRIVRIFGAELFIVLGNRYGVCMDIILPGTVFGFIRTTFVTVFNVLTGRRICVDFILPDAVIAFVCTAFVRLFTAQGD